MSDSNSLAVRYTSKALKGRKFTGLRVAIVAGKSDLEISDNLIRIFRASGIKCWTERDMLPGSERNLAINRAFREADFILILLSRVSISTRGEFQRHITMAVDANGVMPESGIKVIPICLEPCEPPWDLQRLLAIDATQPDAMLRLVLAWAREWERREEADDWPEIDYQSYWK